MASPHLEVFRERSALRAFGRWRWRRVAGNNRVTETSGESFFSRSNATRAALAAHPGDDVKVIER